MPWSVLEGSRTTSGGNVSAYNEKVFYVVDESGVPESEHRSDDDAERRVEELNNTGQQTPHIVLGLSPGDTDPDAGVDPVRT